MLYFVVLWYVLLYPFIRRRTWPYLKRRFPERNRAWQRLFDAYRLCLTYGKVLVDRAVVGILGREAVNITFPEAETLRELLNEGTGLVLVNSHVGSWQLAVAALESINRPISLLMYQHAKDVDRTYFEHAESPEPYQVIDPTGYLGGVLEMMGVLKRNEILCMMGDRVFGHATKTTCVDFLGRKARFPVSALMLASAFGAPVGILHSHRITPIEYELRLIKVIRVPKELGRAMEAYQPWLKEYVETLEAYTHEHPWQFFNFFDMWESD